MENLFLLIGQYTDEMVTVLTGSAAAGQVAWAGLATVAILGFVAVGAMLLIYWERRLTGFIQVRLGPNTVGPQGVLQGLADAVKLMGKEIIIPRAAHRPLFVVTPVLIAVIALGALAVIPLGAGMVIADLECGLFFVLIFSALAPLGMWLAGWASANKYAVVGAGRVVAMMISYEVPLVFSLVGVCMLAGSLNLSKIVAAQAGAWFICTQPVAALVFLVAAVAECKRIPFNLVEAESELVAGPFTEYSGMSYGLLMLSEYIDLIVVSALAVVCFLGGWLAPFGWDWLPSWAWFFIKLNLVITFLFWLHWTFPRMRVDQLMDLCWKRLVPIALVNIAVTAVVICLW